MNTFNFKSRRSPVYGNKGAVATTQVCDISNILIQIKFLFCHLQSFFSNIISFAIAFGKSDRFEYLTERRELL
jgi:hypothetical protein